VISSVDLLPTILQRCPIPHVLLISGLCFCVKGDFHYLISTTELQSHFTSDNHRYQ